MYVFISNTYLFLYFFLLSSSLVNKSLRKKEIEIRQPELVDTFIEETINNLTSSNLSSSNSYPVMKTSVTMKNQNTPSVTSTSKQHGQTHVHGDVSGEEGGVKEKDNDNDDEEDDLDNDDEEEKHASLLNHAKECESKWQEKDTQELTGLFVQNSVSGL